MRTLREFWEAGHGDAEKVLREWFKLCEAAEWRNFADVRATFRTADQVGDKIIVNILRNEYRLIFKSQFEKGRVFIKWVGTHAEYDRLTKRDIESL